MKFLLRSSLVLCLLLVGCKNITHVQTGYVADRDECRGRSEGGVGNYSTPESYNLSDKERNTALLQLFCECMKEKDWKVAGCPKPVVVAAAPAAAQPTVVVVQQQPTGQPAYMPAPYEPMPAAAQPIPHKGVGKKKKACTVPSVCPAPTDYSAAGPAGANYSTKPGRSDYSTGGNGSQGDAQLTNILQKQ